MSKRRCTSDEIRQAVAAMQRGNFSLVDKLMRETEVKCIELSAEELEVVLAVGEEIVH